MASPAGARNRLNLSSAIPSALYPASIFPIFALLPNNPKYRKLIGSNTLTAMSSVLYPCVITTT